jgi:uncharacterized protein YqgV (UPF0045/DUF77 family)
MKRIINMGIQIVPIESKGKKFDVIDHAIGIIQQSGLKHIVTPFETIIEGEEERIYNLLKEVRNACYDFGCDELLINVRFHSAKDKHIYMEEKTAKF